MVAPLYPSFDHLPLAVAVVDDDGIVQDVNACLAELLGRGADALRGQAIGQVLTRAAALLYHSYIFPLLKVAGQVQEVSIQLQGPHGQRIDALLNARRDLLDGQGVVHAVFMRLQERGRLEYQLLTAKRAADEAPGLLFQLRRDAQGQETFTYVTDAVRRLFEVAPSQVLAQADVLWRVVHPDDAATLMQALAASAQTQQPWRCEYRVRLAQGEAWREVHATPHREPDGAVVWNGYMADITDRHRMEASVQDKLAAERANQAKSAFLSRMSHELRTPLNGILGFTQLLQMQDAGNLRVDQRSKLGYIDTAGHSLLRLINEVLEISRIESGHMQVHIQGVRLDDVVRDSVMLIEPLAGQRGARIVCGGDQGLAVRADAHRLGQVLLNLLSNAVKYGPERGQITIMVQGLADERVELSVQDQGAGLNEAQQAQLFQPFNRLGAEQSQIEGVGLGLVITRGLVELMGGQLTVRSQVGQGTCFVVNLAAMSSQAGREQDQGVDASATPASDRVMAQPVKQVLYVEDNAINALLMSSVFESLAGFALQLADRGDKVLAAVAEGPWPDVLLLDMHLPDTDGISLLHALREQPGWCGQPVVAVSADAMPEDVRRALEAGFDDYWTKPLDITRIETALHGLLAVAARSGGTMSV